MERLLALGVDRGYFPRYPLKPVTVDVAELMGGIPLPQGLTGVMSEEEWRAMAAQTLTAVTGMARHPQPEPVIRDVVSVTVLRLLLAAGDRIEDAPAEVRREFLGLPAKVEIQCDRAAYEADCTPRPGLDNPEPAAGDFLAAMIRSGANAWQARQEFGDQDLTRPVWCYQRFGHTLTRLPDGRYVGIGGEHEDYYDPDFCIYNDVVIHDGHGGSVLYRYPGAAFPPTDYHTATWVDDAIVIIGCLGYPEQRVSGHTPVHRLDLRTMSMERLEAHGPGPGWISRHRADLDSASGGIVIHGGDVWEVSSDGPPGIKPNPERFRLNLERVQWERLGRS